MMTVYMNELLDHIEHRQGKLSTREFAETMIAMGLIDHTLCKVLAIRTEVESSIADGDKKIDAMWKASEKFCCSYEYVRKCMYYYTDINMPRRMSEFVEKSNDSTKIISQ